MIGGSDVGVTQEDKTMGMVAHLLGLFSFLGPLVIYLIKRDSRFVSFHALQQVFFQLLVVAVEIILAVTIVGILLVPVVHIAALVVAILAAVKANNGEWYEYPVVGAWARKTVGF